MFEPKINFRQHPPLKSLSAASRRQAETGGFSQAGVPGGPDVLREEEGWPAPTTLPSAKPSPAKQVAAGLHQAGLVGPRCGGCCNWAASFVAWPQVLPCLTWCSLTSSKEKTVSHSCLKLSYFTGLYLKDPILHGPPGSGTETRTSDVQGKLESLQENPKLGRPCACPQRYWSYTSIWREKDWQ